MLHSSFLTIISFNAERLSLVHFSDFTCFVSSVKEFFCVSVSLTERDTNNLDAQESLDCCNINIVWYFSGCVFRRSCHFSVTEFTQKYCNLKGLFGVWKQHSEALLEKLFLRFNSRLYFNQFWLLLHIWSI